MPEGTAMGPRMAEPSHHTLSSLERNLARRDAHAEMAFMKSDVDRLRVDAQSFQQDLQSRLRDPHSGFFRQRPTVMLVSRLVNNWPLEGKREELWQRSNKSQRMLIRYALVAKYHGDSGLEKTIEDLRDDLFEVNALIDMSAWYAAIPQPFDGEV